MSHSLGGSVCFQACATINWLLYRNPTFSDYQNNKTLTWSTEKSAKLLTFWNVLEINCQKINHPKLFLCPRSGGHYVFTLYVPLSRCSSVCLVPTSGLDRGAMRRAGRRPARCPCGQTHFFANMDSPVQKWKNPQGGEQVHYTIMPAKWHCHLWTCLSLLLTYRCCCGTPVDRRRSSALCSLFLC